MKINWKKGDKAVIKKGWENEGQIFEVLGPAIYIKQWWVPVISSECEDPDWYKEEALTKISKNRGI